MYVRGAGAQGRVVSSRGYLNALVESSVANKDIQVFILLVCVRGKSYGREIEAAACFHLSCPRSGALSASSDMLKAIKLHV